MEKKNTIQALHIILIVADMFESNKKGYLYTENKTSSYDKKL